MHQHSQNNSTTHQTEQRIPLHRTGPHNPNPASPKPRRIHFFLNRHLRPSHEAKVRWQILRLIILRVIVKLLIVVECKFGEKITIITKRIDISCLLDAFYGV